MLNSRNKGKRGEREIIDLLQPIVSDVYHACGISPIPLLQRNTLQSDRGGFDIVGLDWIAPEVKRCEILELDKWWKQCTRQAGQTREPVLFYRKNGQLRWHVRMNVLLLAHDARTQCSRSFIVPAAVDIDDFLRWFRARLTYEVLNEQEA